MNKYRLIISSVAASALVLYGCDYNDDNFEGLDEMVKQAMQNTTAATYTLTADDYSAISKYDQKFASVKSNCFFDNDADAQEAIAKFVAAKYPTGDNGKAVEVTYCVASQQSETDANINKGISYTLLDSDYANVWSSKGIEASYLTPKTLSSIPSILKSAMVDAQSGDVVMVKYNYSDLEPALSNGAVANKEYYTSFDEGIDDWQLVNVKDESKAWALMTRNGDSYVQATANKAEGEVETWLIAPKVNLEDASSAVVTMSICTGYYNDACLHVLVSNDYDGKNINAATWNDVSKSFAYEHSAKYGTTTIAGVADILPYIGSSVYVAVQYVGDGVNKKTTTFQVYDFYVGSKSPYTKTTTYSENFETNNTIDLLVAAGWTHVAAAKDWQLKKYNDNQYLQVSAYGATETNVTWMVTPAIDVPNNGVFTFDINGAYYVADCMKVLLSTDFSGDVTSATWVDYTADCYIPQESKYLSSYVRSASLNLTPYAGQKVYVAFKYEGSDTATTTYQIDNVALESYSANGANKAAAISGYNEQAIFSFDGAAWRELTASDGARVIALPIDVYNSLGYKYLNASNVAAVMPKYLANEHQYASEDDEIVIVYISSSKGNISSVRYIFSADGWVTAANKTVTSQFVKSNGQWMFNPSVVLNLTASKSPEEVAFYQAYTDWVWENVDQKNGISAKGQGFVTSYGNNNYYDGTSAYYTNVDWRPSAAKTQYPSAFDGMSDDQIVEFMKSNFIEVSKYVLAILYPNAKPIDGAEVTYTINFVMYNGSNTNYTIVFKVVAPATFEYVDGSLKPVE
ncbi:MAG: DUF5017 domain-containing protein [Marinilabiliaceae bacterium]|nr:DUF5017 domain-containing protein [Marinilabiliaceae bacterium]